MRFKIDNTQGVYRRRRCHYRADLRLLYRGYYARIREEPRYRTIFAVFEL